MWAVILSWGDYLFLYDLQLLNTMLETALRSTICTLDVGDTTSSIMARAKGVLGATTTGRGCKILLGIIAGTKSMYKGLRTIYWAGANSFAGDEIQLLQNNYFGDHTCATLLEETIVVRGVLLNVRTLWGYEYFYLFLGELSTYSCWLIGNER